MAGSMHPKGGQDEVEEEEAMAGEIQGGRRDEQANLRPSLHDNLHLLLDVSLLLLLQVDGRRRRPRGIRLQQHIHEVEERQHPRVALSGRGGGREGRGRWRGVLKVLLLPVPKNVLNVLQMLIKRSAPQNCDLLLQPRSHLHQRLLEPLLISRSHASSDAPSAQSQQRPLGPRIPDGLADARNGRAMQPLHARRGLANDLIPRHNRLPPVLLHPRVRVLLERELEHRRRILRQLLRPQLHKVKVVLNSIPSLSLVQRFPKGMHDVQDGARPGLLHGPLQPVEVADELAGAVKLTEAEELAGEEEEVAGVAEEPDVVNVRLDHSERRGLHRRFEHVPLQDHQLPVMGELRCCC
mmetsp:Transcript_18547/g.42313  ORF Transcript_18547/g.42313 Transcript_18547/m.42313 type:complete len:352 (-) Transcript_18547:848-1903(-)